MVSALSDMRILVLVLLAGSLSCGMASFLVSGLRQLDLSSSQTSVLLRPDEGGVDVATREPIPEDVPIRASPPGTVEHVSFDEPKDEGWVPPAWLVASGIGCTIVSFGLVATALMWARAAANDEPDPPPPEDATTDA